jgi:hypothetical protein
MREIVRLGAGAFAASDGAGVAVGAVFWAKAVKATKDTDRTIPRIIVFFMGSPPFSFKSVRSMRRL